MDFMKRRLLLMALLMLIAGAGFHCKKNNTPGIWQGKLVAGLCGQFVVQLQSGPISDSSVLTKSWINRVNDSIYSNVFGVKDGCTFAEANLKIGDVFTFTLNGAAPVQICVVCDIAAYIMPPTLNTVTNIQAGTIH
jgi:hypothetical protein